MALGVLVIICIILSAIICAATGAFIGITWLWALPVGALGCFLVVAGLLFLIIWGMSLAVDTSKPQEEDNPFYRRTAYLIASLLKSVLQIRVHTTGMEKVPQDGRILLVCNHLSNADPVLLLYYFRSKQLAFISKRENSSMFIVGKLMHKILCQLINRGNDREALKTILKCVQILKEDKASIGVFPEGYTSVDGLLHPFRHGVFKIAQKAQVPIVVCTLKNTQYVFHNGKRLKPTDVYLDVVGVVPPEEIKGITAVQVGTRVHKMMADNLGPDLVLPETEEKP